MEDFPEKVDQFGCEDIACRVGFELQTFWHGLEMGEYGGSSRS